jgi:hypothetical protein
VAISRRSTSQDTHATAATAITLALPAGTVTGDRLVAVMAAIVQQTITPPAGWTLLGTQLAGANTQLWAYYRDPAGDAGPYVWSLPSSTKCWGWMGSYTGCDLTAAPGWASASNAAGTSQATPSLAVPASGWLLTGAGARHAFTGAATSWTTSDGLDSERLDFGSSSASGSDISGAVYDSNRALTAGSYTRTLTASQSEGQVAAWAIALASTTPPPPPVTGRAGWGIPI